MQEAASLNGEVRREPLRASRALSLALAAFVGVVSLLVAPSEALAAAAAPMCNELGQSIEAPPTIWVHRGGSIRAVPSCPISKLWQVDAHTDRAERVPPIVLREGPLGTFTGSLTKPLGARLLVPEAPRFTPHPAHVGDVYRPPRA